MGESSIEWTDKTWNPVTGCDKVSPGCKNCYAEKVSDRFWTNCFVCWHPEKEHDLPNSKCHLCPEGNSPECDGFVRRKFTDVISHYDRVDQPMHWKKPQLIFVNSMSDLFHDDVPFEFIDRVFAVMALTPRHTYQILTKRPERMLEYVRHARDLTTVFPNDKWPIREDAHKCWPLPNVWLGVSCENQQYADERIPLLLDTPAAKRFVSYEPALGPVDFTAKCPPFYAAHLRRDRISWVIVGGESGPGARPLNVQWVRDVIAQCRAADVACFVKQLGVKPYEIVGHGFFPHVPGHPSPVKYMKFKSSKGGAMSEWPEDLRVREFPV